MVHRAGSFGERRLLTQHRKTLLTTADLRPGTDPRSREWLRVTAHMAVVVALLCLAAANIHLRWTWSEMEDGVLWTERGGDITAVEIQRPSPAARADVRPGDVLVAVNGVDIKSI